MPTSKLFMSLSDEVTDQPPNAPAPHLVKNGQQNTPVAAGGVPEEIYAGTLPSWRAVLRCSRRTVVEQESETSPSGRQYRVRAPWLDTYILHTSMLGTFVFLPAFFFFGHDDLVRRLCYALAFGAYMLSYLKNLVCSPRPYAPPVVRLTVENHHLEYGSPSTHSTNSTPMALFLGAHVYDLHHLVSLSTTAFATWVLVLHCFVGIILGIISWLLQHLVMPEVEKWIQSSHWSAPLIVTVVCLLLINQHPSPVDDYPCFEDITAVASVILGIITSFRCSKRVPALNIDLFTSVSPGAALDSPTQSRPQRNTGMPASRAGGVDEAGARLSGAGPRLDRVQETAITFEEAGEGGTVEDGEMNIMTPMVVVYAIASVMVPALFEALERGV
ncbi:hypothetical protein EDB83DRAFT_2677077 [Lactarius deliciosus]|nr:hypothetical protein EDB83DRAFT_2677077 [Lactarius deliciosus]